MANLTPALAGSTPSAAAEAPSSNPPVDVYVSINDPPYGYSNSSVLVPAGGGAPVAIPGFVDNYLTAMAVDSQGDVYMADTTQWNSIEEFPVGQGGAFNSIPCGCGAWVSGLALDTKDDLYFVSTRNTGVEKITAGTDFPTDVPTPECGVESGAGCTLNDPNGIAVDPQGDLFVANTGNNQVLKIPANGGPEIQVASGLTSPVSVAVDAQGDVFVGESGGVVEIPTNGGSQRTLFTTSDQVEVAADLAGDVYLTDPAEGGLIEIPAGGGPAITLGSSLSGFVAVPPAPLPQSIAFTSTPPQDATMNGPTYDVSASGGASGNPVVFTSATPAVCIVSGSTVSFVGVGACTIDANQAASAAYAAADEQSQTIEVIDNDLALMNVPANLTVNANSPQGAVVTYTPPTVVDEDIPLPTVTCTPASGATFAIGRNSVACTVSATQDTNSPVSKSFTVNVLGAAAQLANLQPVVTSVGRGTSLADKVSEAQADVSANNTAGACGVLAAFIHEVNAQAGKSISKSTAASLIASATRMQSVLGC